MSVTRPWVEIQSDIATADRSDAPYPDACPKEGGLLDTAAEAPLNVGASHSRRF